MLLFARLSGSVAQFALTAIIARYTSLSTAAPCLLLLSWAQVGSALVAWGHPIVALREVAAAAVVGVPYSLRRHLSAVSITGVGLSIVAVFIPQHYFDTSQVLALGVAATAQGALRVTSQALKAVRREAIAISLEFAFSPAVLAVWAVGVTVAGGTITTIRFGVAQAVAICLAFGLCIAAWHRTNRLRENAGEHQQAQLALTTGEFSGLHTLGALQVLMIAMSHIPVLCAPLVLSRSSVAIFVVAFRVASLVTTVQNALNSYYGPRYARAFARRDMRRVRQLLLHSQWVAGLTCLPILLVIPWSGRLFQVFGHAYSHSETPYAAVAVGLYVNAATGVLSYILSLSRRERQLLAVNLCFFAVQLLGWAAMLGFGSRSIVLYASIYSAQVGLRDVVNLAIARSIVRRGSEEHSEVDAGILDRR